MENLYEILEVSPNASKEVIDRAYKVLAKKYHPDLQENKNDKKTEEMMKKINYAYSIIGDEQKRKEYDVELEEEKRTNELKNEQNKNEEDIFTNRNDYNKYYENESEFNNSYENPRNWREYYNNLNNREQRKIRKNIEKDAKNEYRYYYREYFKSLGLKIKHKWTWREVKILLICILTLIILGAILWIIPPSREWLTQLYNSNVFIKILCDLIFGFFKAIVTFIKSLFK